MLFPYNQSPPPSAFGCVNFHPGNETALKAFGLPFVGVWVSEGGFTMTWNWLGKKECTGYWAGRPIVMPTPLYYMYVNGFGFHTPLTLSLIKFGKKKTQFPKLWRYYHVKLLILSQFVCFYTRIIYILEYAHLYSKWYSFNKLFCVFSGNVHSSWWQNKDVFVYLATVYTSHMASIQYSSS